MSDAKAFRILVVGGGVAGIEALLALRELVGERAQLELLAPGDELKLKPLAVGEAFGLAEPPRLQLADIARDLDAKHHRDALASVQLDKQLAVTRSGQELAYDALLLAVGAMADEALPGAITYRGGPDNDRLAALLEEIDAGSVHRVVFTVPSAVQWPLPIYELALQTAARANAGSGPGPEISLITYEPSPLTLFGPKASDSVADIIRGAGIELITGARSLGVTPVGLALADGRIILADRVVAGPRLSVVQIEGIPQGPDGFIDTDAHMRLVDQSRAFAAGDSTWYPIKQGGLAAQQADVAASSIAALIDPGIEPATFQPTLRGALFTGGAPQYLRAEVAQRFTTSTTDSAPLWWPPSKIAGRHLATYLAERHGFSGPLEDLKSLEEADGEEAAHGDSGEALELALSGADADADAGNFSGALRWLEVAEAINLALPSEYDEKRRRWSTEAAAT